MITNYLYRQPSGQFGTFGIFAMPDLGWSCHSLERPWRNNRINISCVSSGIYIVEREYSQKFERDLYELQNVPGRTEIKFHPLNHYTESLGCIGLGMKIDYTHDNKRLLESRKAIEHFENLMAGEPFELVIRNAKDHKYFAYTL